MAEQPQFVKKQNKPLKEITSNISLNFRQKGIFKSQQLEIACRKPVFLKCFLKACDMSMSILNSRSSQKKQKTKKTPQFEEMSPITFFIGNRHSYVTVKLRLALGFAMQISLLGLMAGSKDRCVTVISHHMEKVTAQQLNSNKFQEVAHLDTAVHHTYFVLLNPCYAKTQQ